MAAGYLLEKEEYKIKNLSDDEIWSLFSYLFSSKSANDTSYKFGFLKSILDNLYNVDNDLCLSFDQLFAKFTEIYWNLVLSYHIRQKSPGKTNRRAQIETVLYSAQIKYSIPENVPFESITDKMKIDICKKVKNNCKNNVVGALYADLGGYFYSFSKSEEYIQINPIMYEFVCKHKVAIEKINYYEWARFLERANREEVMDHLLSRIDESTKRDNLDYYRDILFKEFENKCFYCGRKIYLGKVQVDHFIPWSFIKDDNLWNFVLACPQCNGNKSNKLAKPIYLDKIISRNQTMIENHLLKSEVQVSRLKNIYNWAQKNGYTDQWSPKTKNIV